MISPDNDDAGQRYADDVAGLLARLSPAAVVKVVELPERPKPGDDAEPCPGHADAEPNASNGHGPRPARRPSERAAVRAAVGTRKRAGRCDVAHWP